LPSVGTDVGVEQLPDELPPHELHYEKNYDGPSLPGKGSSSLRSLFNFAEMQAPPTP
jgi:hypothetical protein